MKVAGMLVVSLTGVNFGFWSHLYLRCFGQSAIIFSRKGLTLLRLHATKYKKNIIFQFIF